MRKGLCFLVPARHPRRVGLYLAMPSSQRERHKLEVPYIPYEFCPVRVRTLPGVAVDNADRRRSTSTDPPI